MADTVFVADSFLSASNGDPANGRTPDTVDAAYTGLTWQAGDSDIVVPGNYVACDPFGVIRLSTYKDASNYLPIDVADGAEDHPGLFVEMTCTVALVGDGMTATVSMEGDMRGDSASFAVSVDSGGELTATWHSPYSGSPEEVSLSLGAKANLDPLKLRYEYLGNSTYKAYIDDVQVGGELSGSQLYSAQDVEFRVRVQMGDGEFAAAARITDVSLGEGGGFAPVPEPPSGQHNVLIKNTVPELVLERHDVPGTPYVPAQPGRYVYETKTTCGWVYQGPGHYEWWTDPETGQSTLVWIPDGPGGNIGIWTCSTKTVPVYYPPTPARPATPGSSYTTSRYETGFNLGWNSGARSIDIFTGDAVVQFQIGVSVVGVIVGMNIDDGTPVTYNGNTINYGVYAARGSARVVKNGVMGPSLGTYTNDTVFRIERTDDAIEYLVDGVSKHTVASGAPEGSGWLEAAMYSGNDIVFNPSIEQISEPDDTELEATIAGDLPYLVGLLTEGLHTEIAGELPHMSALLTTGMIAPSYAVIFGVMADFSGSVSGLTGELATISGVLAPMEGLLADHPYAVVAGALKPMEGVFMAVEGNTRASFVSGASAHSDIVGHMVLVVSMTEHLVLGSAITASITLNAKMLSTMTLDDVLSFTSTQQAVLWSVATASELTGVSEGEIETWVVNLDGGMFASTEYSNYDFNSYALIGGRHYGAGADGLVLLEGDTDDGDPIRSRISLGKQGGGSAYKKTWSQCYLGMSAQGNLFVKVIAEGAEYIYKTRSFHDELQQERVTFGKGLRTNYVTLEIYNEDGADFELDTVEFKVADLTRKI